MRILLSLLIPVFLLSGEIRVANYNVENLFDLNRDGNEYTEYIPNSKFGWNKKVYKIKLENISRVIYDLKADIIALQEIENEVALNDLRAKLKQIGVNYPYYAIANQKQTVIKCAILSKYPIVNKKEVVVGNRYTRNRNILETTIEIEGKRLKIFTNHWKSKSGGESKRIPYALALKKRLDELRGEEFIIIGDLNSNYNEFETFKRKIKLNDTNGKTGINHKLKTLKNEKLITKEEIKKAENSEFLYNLWLELPSEQRWTHIFFGLKESLDNIIIPNSMFDNKNIEYIENSFNKFYPTYLLDKKNRPLRWRVSKRKKIKHKGEGFSDHLPIYADFKIK